MIANFYLTHALILLAAIGASLAAVPEALGRPVRRWLLLVPGILGAFAALVLVAYPELSQLWRPQVWFLGIGAGLGGALRGRLLDMESNQELNLVRVRRAPEELMGGLLMVVFSLIEIGIELKAGDNVRFEPTMELAMAVVGGFLLGRGIMSFVHSRDIEHMDLEGP
jgi:hypothetical protein